MFCIHCGQQNKGNARFCGRCGIPMNHKRKKKWILPAAAGVLLALSGGGAAFYQMNKAADSPAPLEETEPVALVAPKEKELPSEPLNDTKEAEIEKEKTEIIKETLPRVFTIFTKDGLGSGFLYEKGGLIVTNAHVVAGFTDVIVRNSDGKDAAGKVIGISDKYDVALVQSKSYQKLNPLELEPKETPIGTEIIALGSPTGFENTASIGYLTGQNRDLELGFVYEKVYQIDAQIDQGSSGGPLIDATTGKVIGINSLLYKENNLFGFSIPLYSVTGLIDKWVQKPMTPEEVTAVFEAYDGYEPTPLDEYDHDYDEFYEEDGYTHQNEGFNDGWLEEFIQSFRSEYETALYFEDFSYIADFLLPGSAAYVEYEQYLYDIQGEGFYFEFLNTEITKVDIQDDSAYVYTSEVFDFYNDIGEKTSYNKQKIYHVVADQEGYYQIKEVRNR